MSERVANSQRRAEVRCISRAQFSRANSAVIPKLRTSHLSIGFSRRRDREVFKTMIMMMPGHRKPRFAECGRLAAGCTSLDRPARRPFLNCLPELDASAR